MPSRTRYMFEGENESERTREALAERKTERETETETETVTERQRERKGGPAISLWLMDGACFLFCATALT